MENTADRGRDNIVTADDCETSKRSNTKDFSGNDEGMEESLRKLLHLYPVVDTHLGEIRALYSVTCKPDQSTVSLTAPKNSMNILFPT